MIVTDTAIETLDGAGKLADQVSSTPVGEELAALGVMAAGLERLDVDSRGRVLAYLVARFGSAGMRQSGSELRAAQRRGESESAPESVPDIRSFREIKAPASGQEMAAVLAFYLSEVLPEAEQREAIGPPDVDKYFKQAGFPLPARTRAVLTHAKTAGYLEEAGSRGAYKLSPVGYNLVKYRLPRNADTQVTRNVRRRPTRGKAPMPSDTTNVEGNAES